MVEPLPFPDAEAIHGAAATVLKNPDYTLDLYTPPYMSFFRNLIRMLNDFLQPVFDALGKLFHLPPLLLWPLGILAAVLLLVLVWHTVRAIRTAFARRQLAGYTPARPEQVQDTDYWRKEAEAVAEAGDFLTALRLLFRAGLLRLEGGKLRRAATNREYLRRYRNTALEAPLREFVQLIDYKWYGGRDCIVTDWEAGQNAYQTICRHSKPVRLTPVNASVNASGIASGTPGAVAAVRKGD